MIDDTERRLRDGLRGANLPPAPNTLRDALQSIAASPAPAAPRRPWIRVLPALAAVVVLAIVAGALTGGFGLMGVASTASPTAPAETPSPGQATPTPPAVQPSDLSYQFPLSVDVLTEAQLFAAVDALKSGAVGAHVVVADVNILRQTHSSPRQLECQQPLGTCLPVGLLGRSDQQVTVRTEDGIVPPPTTDADLRGPVALRLVPGGPIEFLGHVDLASGGGQLDTDALRVATPTAGAGSVVAVLGWLGKMSGASCGPVSDLPQPFNCPGITSFLSDQPLEPVVKNGNSYSGTLPATAVPVGSFTYDEFAPSPVTREFNGLPRLGMYLLRMVTVDQANCQRCRGWLLVGRLDARPPTASASAQPNAGQRVYSAAELGASLAADRASFAGKAVIVDGTVVGWPTGCVTATIPSDAPCIVGTLDGTSEAVQMSSYTLALSPRDPSAAPSGPMAVRVLANGLEYLGRMGSANGADFEATVSNLKEDHSNNMPLLTFIVKGWLGTSGALPCPSVPGSSPPEDTPFGGCPFSWLASTSAAKPAISVPVQYSAYDAYTRGTAGIDPQFGTYLVRLVADTRSGGINGPRGWQVVARLDPSP